MNLENPKNHEKDVISVNCEHGFNYLMRKG